MTQTQKQIDYIDTLIEQAYPGTDRATYLARDQISKRRRGLDKAGASELIDELQAEIQRNRPDPAQLRAERARLMARIAEIDEALDG